MTNQRKKAFVVLEGGGAKGVAHVGALKAIEDAGYDVVGLAGTSAGALVAAIYAFGFKADQIIHTQTGRTILQSLSPPREKATDLLGSHWWVIRLLQQMATGWGRVIGIGAALVLLVAAFLHPLAFALLLVLGVFLFLFLIYIVANGLIRLDDCANALQDLFEKQTATSTGKPGTFRSVGPNLNRPILKIVATDINTTAMRVFSSDETPDVFVAEAVAASICIPFVFRSRKISTGLPDHADHHFLDGGLVSNLPAWVFDTERAIHEDAITIVIEIDPGSAVRRLQSTIQWITQTVRSTVFGASDLSIRGVDRLLRVPLSAKPLTVLDLDASYSIVAKIVDQARLTTEAVLAAEEERQRSIDSLRRLTIRILAQSDTRVTAPGDVGNIRVSMAILKKWEVDRLEQDDNHNISAKYIYRAGFGNAPFRLPAFPLANTPEATAILEGVGVYADMSVDGTQTPSNASDPRHAIVDAYRVQVAWVLALPLEPIQQSKGYDSETDESYYFVVVDGSKALTFKGEQLDKRLRVVYHVIQHTVRKLARVDDDDA